MTNAKKFSKVMKNLAKVPSRASTVIARELRSEIIRRMNHSQDPFRNPWPKKADGKASKLKKTGAGRNSILVKPTSGAGIRITVGVLYMVYHQFGGASHLRGPGGSYRLRHKHKDFGTSKDLSLGRNHPPKRSFLPFDYMPDTWEEIITQRIKQMTDKVLSGKRT